MRTHVGSYLWGVRGKLGMLGVRPNLFQGTTRLFVALCLLISRSIQHRSNPAAATTRSRAAVVPPRRYRADQQRHWTVLQTTRCFVLVHV